MSSLALMEVQRALYTALVADGVLMGMVSGVFDVVPQHTALPYVELGDGSQSITPAEAAEVSECRLALYVWTEAAGRKTALSVLNRIHALLHLGTFGITGFQLVNVRTEQAATVIEEQGTRLRGTLVVRMTVVEV